jgi:Ni,Fe-hydrogenase III small subunit
MFARLCRRMMNRSCWVYHANSGGCNGCDIEVLNVLTPYYDAERFGVKLVASPRHADAMLCQGPALRSTERALRRAYEAMPAPKLVIAVGSCATGGGPWFDGYAVLGGIEKVLPVDYWIPGCPPRPEAILHGVAVALGLVEKAVAPKAPVMQSPFPFPRYHAEPVPAPVPESPQTSDPHRGSSAAPTGEQSIGPRRGS